ncbi:hypothetical protein BP6252_04245 [Coleophoma cylindrospora]|uniref:C2H2-type domain-containing protein n=1 Tax=Coleophoma cylindrospora TaxID=1849047 RepID=A0A3D8RZX6_9HELO|nr:hypothetical protein BP6252_04245 [Coleophoma cylindrospora]
MSDFEEPPEKDARWHDARHQQKSRSSTYFHALEALPTQRAIPWKKGKEMPPEKSLMSARVQVRTGCILSIKGQPVEPKCDHCALSSSSKLTQCIALPNWFHGACAACVMRARGAQCTLRTAAEDTRSRLLEIMNAQLSDQDMTANAPRESGNTIEDSPDRIGVGGASLVDQNNAHVDPDAVNTAAYGAFRNRPDGVTEFERKGGSYYIYGGEVYCRVARGKDRNNSTLLCHTATRFSCKQKLMLHIRSQHRHEWDLMQENRLIKPGKKSYVEMKAAEKHFSTQLALIRQALPSPGENRSTRQPRSVCQSNVQSSAKRKRPSLEMPEDSTPSPGAVYDDRGSSRFEEVQDEERRQSKRRPVLTRQKGAVTWSRPVTEKGSTQEALTSKLQPQYDEQHYRCHICNRLLGSRDMLKRHIRISHQHFGRKDYATRSDQENRIPESSVQARTPASRLGAVAAQPGAMTAGPDAIPSNLVEAPMSLIDTLPKKHQRNIYGIMSGLQAGIGHLQKELDNLKKTLGIESDE